MDVTSILTFKREVNNAEEKRRIAKDVSKERPPIEGADQAD